MPVTMRKFSCLSNNVRIQVWYAGSLSNIMWKFGTINVLIVVPPVLAKYGKFVFTSKLTQNQIEMQR